MNEENVEHVYSGILLSHKKKNKVMPFAATWMDLGIIIILLYYIIILYSDYVKSERERPYEIPYM